MSMPAIKVQAREVQKHGATVLKIQGEHYASVEDVADAMHVKPEIIYCALCNLQEWRKRAAREATPDIRPDIDASWTAPATNCN